jgi:hypothetical protein
VSDLQIPPSRIRKAWSDPVKSPKSVPFVMLYLHALGYHSSALLNQGQKIYIPCTTPVKIHIP